MLTDDEGLVLENHITVTVNCLCRFLLFHAVLCGIRPMVLVVNEVEPEEGIRDLLNGGKGIF